MFHHFQHGLQSSRISAVEEVAELKKLLKKESVLRKAAEEEVNSLKSQLVQWKRSEVCLMFLWGIPFQLCQCFNPPPFPLPNLWRLNLTYNDTLGIRNFEHLKASWDAGRWGTSERETWRRNSNTPQSVVANEFWSWWGVCLELMTLRFSLNLS